MDFDENGPQQEGNIHELNERLGREYMQESPVFQTLVMSKNLVQRYLPQQADLDRILKVIQRKVLKGTNLSVKVK